MVSMHNYVFILRSLQLKHTHTLSTDLSATFFVDVWALVENKSFYPFFMKDWGTFQNLKGQFFKCFTMSVIMEKKKKKGCYISKTRN